MRRWLRRIRGAIGMGVTWAVAWGLVVVLLGLTTILFPGLGFIFEAADDELLPLMLVSSFAGGVAFSTVLGIAGRRRRFDELSVPQFAAWGAIGGAALTLLPAVGTVVEGRGSVTLAVTVVSAVAVLGAASAAGSLLLARVSEDGSLLDAADEVAEVGLTGEEAQKLLGRQG